MYVKKRILWPGIISSIMIVFIIGGILLFNAHIMNKVSNSTDATMEEIIIQQAFNFSSKIEGEMTAMKMIAAGIATSSDVNDIKLETITKISEKSDFDYIMVVDKKGDARYSNGSSANLSDRDYFQEALAGETVLSEPVRSKIRDADIIALATPITYNGEIIGVLTGSHLADTLDYLFLPSFGGKGYAYITNNEGKVIAESLNSYSLLETDNAFDLFRKAHFYDGDDFATIQRKVYANQSGHSKYVYKDQRRLMHYMTIKVNGWNIFSIVPDEVVSQDANEITLSTTLLSLAFVGMLIVLVLRIFRMQRANLEKMTELAFVDELTKAATLSKFKLDAQELLTLHPDKTFILIKLDVANFKMINRIYGYTEGDRLLIGIANAIRTKLPASNGLFARFNTDEFIIMHEINAGTNLKANRAGVQKVIRDSMGDDFRYKLFIPTGRYIITPGSEHDITSAIEKVSFAHSQAKQNKIELYDYDESVSQNALYQKEIENKMEAALHEHEFKVYLQPKYYLSDETLAGAEALVRWKSGDGDIVYPSKFIPLFEENGFITKLDMYMFEKICVIIKEWLAKGLTPVTVSVNFSRNHLDNPGFVDALCGIADKYGVDHGLLEIELTESTILQNEDILTDVLAKLHRAGFTLSMDDFGTGYSSLGFLKNIPVDVIKIDRSFFTTANDAARAKIVISNIIKMAGELGIETVAEGVESVEHIELLRELGCDIVQSYYFAMPMPEPDFVTRLSAANK